MKKLIFIFVTLFISCVLPAFAHGQPDVLIHQGFLNGNDYLGMSDIRQRTYAMGIVEGIMLSPWFGAPRSELGWFENCIEGMNDIQVAAIISKYLENHPGEWHKPLHFLTYRTMREACKNYGSGFRKPQNILRFRKDRIAEIEPECGYRIPCKQGPHELPEKE